MHDVATYCRWKFVLEGVPRIGLGLVLLTVALFVPIFVGEEVRQVHSSPGMMAVGLFPLLLGYGFFSSGIRRMQAACLPNCWLRAGPAGLSFRLPYGALGRTLFLTYRVVERTVPWADVRRSYELQYKLNGLPFGTALILETKQGRYNFGGYFRESAGFILAACAAEKSRAP